MADNNITLREYVDTRFSAQENAVQSALAAADRAVAKAEAASEKRFEAVNEFRASLADQTRTLMPRTEAEQGFKAITEKIEALTVRVNARDDRGKGMSEGWALLIGAVGLLSTIGALVFAFLR